MPNNAIQMNIIFLFITWAKLQRSVVFSKLLPRFYVLPDKTSLSMSTHRLRLQLQSAALATDYNYGLHYKSAALSQSDYKLHYKTATLPLLVADDCAQDDENGLETPLKKTGKKF